MYLSMLFERIVIIASVAVCCQISICSSYRILGVFPLPAPSHYFLGSNLLKGFAEAGHDVTIIAPFKEKNPPKNGSWREIYLEGHEEMMKEHFQKTNMTSRITSKNPFNTISMLVDMSKGITEQTIIHKNLQALIASKEKFDAVIVSEFIVDGLKALANIFDGHLISFTNHGAINWYYSNIGHFVPPSAFPEALLGYPAKMNFFQRVVNTASFLMMRAFHKYLMFPYHSELVKKYFPQVPPLSDIAQNVSLVLINAHPSLTFVYPKVPTMIEVGGFHVKPTQQLPSDLKKVLDDAKEGVIYFSMGSNFKSDDLPYTTISAILKTFSKRKEKILWKWNQDTLPGKPDNVQIGKWFPQQEILAHPNVKLFITHSGFLSTTETIYQGVPIVAIPLGADQRLNANSAAQDGYAVVVSLDDFTEETFGGAIEEVISNPKYKQAVKERSKMFHDRQRPPIEDAVYWVEYVIRHNGAKHLRVASSELSWYQYYLLDVFGFIALVLFLTLYVTKKVFGFLIRKCSARKPKLKKS